MVALTLYAMTDEQTHRRTDVDALLAASVSVVRAHISHK